MEEDDTIIIQVIFKLEDGRLYNFDVDRTTTLYETKKILSNAAHILKNSFTLYHEGQEYSNEYDEQPLVKIFPTLRKIEFYLKIKKNQEEQDENEHEQISVKYNIKEPCKEHIGKFLVLYCISCKKSICNECFSISHNNHEVEEKADYLMPAKILMERIFANSFMFKSDPKLSNYMSCVSFRSIIKTEIFDRMRQLINELESKCINCLEFFSFNEDSTEKNNDLNLELLKKYCTSSFIKLKNNIDTKEILINDEVFLSLYNKLKAIKDYEISLFTENSNKYKALNQFFLPFTQAIKNMSIDVNNILSRYINNDIYAKFKEDISKNIVDVVQKEDVIRFMFENVNVPKSALIRPDENYNKNSHTPNINQRLLPSILLFNENKNNGSKQNISSNININTISNNATNQMSNISNGNININPLNTNFKYQQIQKNFSISSPIQFSSQQKQSGIQPNMNLLSSISKNNSLFSMQTQNIQNAVNTNMVNMNIPNIQNNPTSSISNINIQNMQNNNNSVNMNTQNIGANMNSQNITTKMNTQNLTTNINTQNLPTNINTQNLQTNTQNLQTNINNQNLSANMNTQNLASNINTQNLTSTHSNSLNMNLSNIKNVTNSSNMNIQTIQNTNNSISNIQTPAIAIPSIPNSISPLSMNIPSIKNTTSSVSMNMSTIKNTTNSLNINNPILSTNNNINMGSNMNNISSMNNNMNNYYFYKTTTTTECSHETSVSKEEKDKEKEKLKSEKIDKMEVEESGQTPPTQNSPNIKNTEVNYTNSITKIEEMKANLADNNLYTSPITKKTLISVHLSPTKKDDIIENKSAVLSNSFIQQKSFIFQNDSKDKKALEMPTVNNKIESSSNAEAVKNSINNVSIFSGKLIDVLNKEKSQSLSGEKIKEKKEEITPLESPNFSKKLLTSSNTNIDSSSNTKEKYFSQTIENSQLTYNLNNPSPKNVTVSFMYPVYKANIVKGAIDKNTIQEMKINFNEFTNEDPIITEFPNGGAYCNYENNLYFTGGQEYIKGAGKLFLSIPKTVHAQSAVKLPSMKNSHFNHSMIADKEKIYVIGGYDSNKCEVYDIATKTWTEMPDLIEKERQRSMLFIENNYLYCFMGLSQNGILDSVERIKLDKIEEGWETIIIHNNEDINLKFYGAGIIRMRQTNKIYLIGGKKENKKKETVYKRSIYEFSFDDFTMTVSDFKIENDLFFVENRLFIMDENDLGNFINVGNGYLISMPNLIK